MAKKIYHCPAVPGSKRMTDRVYSHCVVAKDSKSNEVVATWCGRADLAQKQLSQFNNKYWSDARVEPVIQVDKSGNPLPNLELGGVHEN